MKKLLLLAAAAAAILPMAAQAESTAYGQVTYKTQVGKTCAISGLKQGNGIGAVEEFTNAEGGVATKSLAKATVTFDEDELVDKTTARAKAVRQYVKLTAFCNYVGHKVSLESQNNGLTNDATVPSYGDFHNRIKYKARITDWGRVTGVSYDLALFETDGDLKTRIGSSKSASSAEITHAIHASGDKTADLLIETFGSTVPLVRGDYSDVLTIKLGASF